MWYQYLPLYSKRLQLNGSQWALGYKYCILKCVRGYIRYNEKNHVCIICKKKNGWDTKKYEIYIKVLYTIWKIWKEDSAWENLRRDARAISELKIDKWDSRLSHLAQYRPVKISCESFNETSRLAEQLLCSE